jgi:acyl-CoA synthetase (AMP-forming)/AMP-acid ligase II/acyl carrier protein
VTSGTDFKTIESMVRHAAERTPSAAAILAPGQAPLTYGRLAERMAATRRRLNELGVGRGDRAALILPNGAEMAVAFLGVACSATCAPLNLDCRATEFESYLSDLGADVVMLPAGSDSSARQVARSLGIRVVEVVSASQGEAGVFDLDGEPAAAPRRSRAAARGDLALVLHTSGTTSRPKLVPLNQANLCAGAANVRESMQITAADRCLSVMPLFHIHGLVAALLASLSAGASVACTPGFVATRFFEWMDELQPTWYTAVPTMHQAILARAGDHRALIARQPLRAIRSSSAPLPPQVMAELESTFAAPVIEAYGMTEAAHQMASNPLPPRPRKPGSVGLAAGPQVAVTDQTGAILPPGSIGEVVIRGTNVMVGYLNDPEANREAFRDGWFRTGDQGWIDSDGYLFLTGRLKELINRGGEKVSPRQIEEVLLDHPAVAQAVAFAVPNARLGEEVAAAVVLHPGAEATPKELRRLAAERLADFKVPSTVVILEEIPKGPTGKLQRIGLAKKLGLPTVGDAPGVEVTPYVAPRTPIEATIAGLWRQVLKTAQVGIHDRFLDLGGDSILATMLVSRIRDVLRVELSLIDFFDAPTVEQQARIVQDTLVRGDAAAGDSMKKAGARQ